MKRVLFIFIVVLCGCLFAQAQSHYSVYKYAGKVEFKKRGSNTQWIAAENGMEVSLLDTVRIGKNGSVSVMDDERRVLYRSVSSGQMSVITLMREAKKQDSKTITGRVIREMSSGNETPANTHSMQVIGACARGVISSDSISMMADMLAWIGAQACSGIESPKVEGITFRTITAFGDLDFIYENHTDKDYFMNVLHVNKQTNKASLCYVVVPESKEATTCSILPGGYCQCGSELYFPNSENDVYVLIATEIPFDAYAVDNELKRHPIDKAAKAELDILYMWL